MSPDILRLGRFVREHAPLVVITGAGCSTPSGIGDYRDRHGAWKREPPIELQAFLGSHEARRRYWLRSMRGWPEFEAARPNAAHRSLRQLELDDRLTGVITQNVDDLHHRAGQRRIECLHGQLRRARCLSCGDTVGRVDLQTRLEADNPRFTLVRARAAPDGDADTDELDLTGFRVPGCLGCGGLLKPDVVFFGDSVPPDRVRRCRALVADAGGMLVIGSSLMVYSSYRFVRQAVEQGIPVAMINLGRSRADDCLAVKVVADAAQALPALVDHLSCR